MRRACARELCPRSSVLLEHRFQPTPARSADWPRGPCLGPAQCIPEPRQAQRPERGSRLTVLKHALNGGGIHKRFFSKYHQPLLILNILCRQTMSLKAVINTSVSTATIFILVMASIGRSDRNAPMRCSHGRAFSPTSACLPPSHSPGLQWLTARKSSPRRKRRSHARTWLFRPPMSRAVSNASSGWNRSVIG